MYDVSVRKISCEQRFVKQFRGTEKLKFLPCIYGKKDRMLYRCFLEETKRFQWSPRK